MKITVENKKGELVRETEYNSTALLLGTGLGLAYGLVSRRLVLTVFPGGIGTSILGTLFGVAVGGCVGHTVYELALPDEPKKEEEVVENGSNN